MIDFIVVGFIILSLSGIIYSKVKKAKAGESSACGCGCSGCSIKSCPSHQEI